MPTYRYAGLTLASDFSFPELPISSSRRAALRISLGERRRHDTRWKWQHRWKLPGGGIWMNLTRVDGTHVVQFPGLSEFEISGTSIACHPRSGIPLHTMRHLLLDQVLPAMLASGKRLVLHASAVRLNGEAVGFLGRAGSGKSTFAAALALAGASTLTDDALLVELRRARPVAIPTYPGLRLWPASGKVLAVMPAIRRRSVAHYTAKQRWCGPGVPFSERPLKLRTLYVLRRGRTPRLQAVSGRESIMALIRYAMMLDVHDDAAVRKGFDLAERIAARVELIRLVVPRGARGLAAACRMVEARMRRR